MNVKSIIEGRFFSLFQMVFPSQKQSLEVGVVGSTLFFVATVIALTAFGFVIQSKLFQVLTCMAAIAGYFVFVSIHRRD